MTKSQVARKLPTLSGRYRVRTVPGWGGPWVWEYKRRGDNMRMGWLSVCPVKDAARHFGWESANA
jgi:hypothetical protein